MKILLGELIEKLERESLFRLATLNENKDENYNDDVRPHLATFKNLIVKFIIFTYWDIY